MFNLDGCSGGRLLSLAHESGIRTHEWRVKGTYGVLYEARPPASCLLLRLFDATCYVNARGRGPPEPSRERRGRLIRIVINDSRSSSHLTTTIQPLDNREYHRAPRRMIIIILASDGIDTLGDAELSSTVEYVVPSASYCWLATASLWDINSFKRAINSPRAS